jgi:hypothetical protein
VATSIPVNGKYFPNSLTALQSAIAPFRIENGRAIDGGNRISGFTGRGVCADAVPPKNLATGGE